MAMPKGFKSTNGYATLSNLGGKSYQEIADCIGCSTGTVMSRLFYARKKLKEILGDIQND